MALGVSFVGYGSIAAAHASALRVLGGVDFDCVVGRNPETTSAFAEEWGFQHWTLDLDEALARPTTDAVIITSPSDLHADQSVATLSAGKHLLIEIPVATNWPDVERVARAARESDRVVMMAHTQRFAPAQQELRRRLRSGEFRPHHAVLRWFFLRRSNVNWMGRQRTWTDNLLWHHGCHVVDSALWILGGEGGDVQAQFGPPHAELGVPLDLDLHFRVGDTLVTVAMSYNAPWTRHDYHYIGEEASIEFRGDQLWGEHGVIWAGEGGNRIVEQNREFLTAIRDGREASPNVEDVLPAMRVLAEAQRQLEEQS